MKQRIKNLIFDISYLVPLVIIQIMSLTKLFGEGFFPLLFILNIPLSFCFGISLANVLKNIMELKRFLKIRKKARLMGLDVCPKCLGVGWLDWVEQITGKKEGNITDGEEQ